ncbi:MAG: AbrB/MazE/SpoVT family DNA-binding domain-containing protein [Crocinitomicaceae bacterium]|jgi:bifunctional DNA-binding transcriptional regulator/antitoxin component of YhaV-PrlF toxin-antitoxin module|nr:AbrB/MazE/SpoVT family DNA-binding domain-containing protein [Crocinitomicaceae bacterium]
MKVSELEVKESVDGELYFRLPDDLLDRLGWEEGDDVKFIEKDGGFIIQKVKYETIELDFDKDELFKYMQHAHEQGVSFNQWIENVMKEYIKHEEVKEKYGAEG